VKQVAIVGDRRATLVEVPEPQPKDDWAVVKVHAAPMCAEYKAFVSGGKAERLGHEAAGEVAAIAQPGRVRVGDRVVVMPQYPCGKCPLCVAGDYIHWFVCFRRTYTSRPRQNRSRTALRCVSLA
jgi:L-iditol 2-dehydrogenase